MTAYTPDIVRSDVEHVTPRQFCSECLCTVGTLPTGEVRPYRTTLYVWPDGDVRRYHACVAHS